MSTNALRASSMWVTSQAISWPISQLTIA